MRTKDYDDARAAPGFPKFALGFPENATLDAIVVDFARGDYRSVRVQAAALAERGEDDEAVKAAAEVLLRATEPDPTAKILFMLTGILLVFLTAWWLTHDHPTVESSAPRPLPTVETIK